MNPKVTLTKAKYELIDRGPNYMRCAIKSVELLKIQHLSLPDNMLGIEEAKMLAGMIKVNPPLRTLNLEMNNLDAHCGQLLAAALKQNTNLQMLNISKNKLSDVGVNCLFQSLIESRLVILDKELKSLKNQETVKVGQVQAVEMVNKNDYDTTIKPLHTRINLTKIEPNNELVSPRNRNQLHTQNNTHEEI